MDRTQAHHILTLLAKGICPATGELLGADSPLNQPDVIRALHVALVRLAAPSREARRAELPDKAGSAWSPAEDDQLVRGFVAGMKPPALALRHGRTRGAIESRLAKLGIPLVGTRPAAE